MAIARDAVTNPAYLGSGTSVNFSHTCTGSDRILFVFCWRRSGSAITGVTYNGVAMTSLGTEVLAGIGSGSQYLTVWYLVAPATGSNTVTVSSASGSTEHIDSAVSYTGASQTGVPDASTSLARTSQANTAATLSSIADNCWATMFMRLDTAATISAGAGTTQTAYTANLTSAFDNNAAKTPAGSITLNATHSAADVGWWMLTFAPSGGAPSTFIPKIMMS